MEFVYLGYDRFDAATNMALDEIALYRAASEKKTYIRFYDFERPALVLSHRESMEDVDAAACRSAGFDITRRLSHGSVIFCDDRVLAYSIACPSHDPTEEHNHTPGSAHNYFATRIAEALKKAGVEDVGIGEHFSVRIEGKPVAGHGQRYLMGRALLYHGVMAVDSWDTDLVNSVIRLRHSSNGGRTEYQLVSELPAVREYADVGKETLASMILDSITDGNYSMGSIGEMYAEALALRNSKYNSRLWVEEAHTDGKPPAMVKGQGFCFIDMIHPEGYTRRI